MKSCLSGTEITVLVGEMVVRKTQLLSNFPFSLHLPHTVSQQ